MWAPCGTRGCSRCPARPVRCHPCPLCLPSRPSRSLIPLAAPLPAPASLLAVCRPLWKRGSPPEPRGAAPTAAPAPGAPSPAPRRCGGKTGSCCLVIDSPPPAAARLGSERFQPGKMGTWGARPPAPARCCAEMKLWGCECHPRGDSWCQQRGQRWGRGSLAGPRELSGVPKARGTRRLWHRGHLCGQPQALPGAWTRLS